MKPCVPSYLPKLFEEIGGVFAKENSRLQTGRKNLVGNFPNQLK